MVQELDELRRTMSALQDKVAGASAMQEDVDKLNKKLHSESMLKQQAVNKLAEIMNRYTSTHLSYSHNIYTNHISFTSLPLTNFNSLNL